MSKRAVAAIATGALIACMVLVCLACCLISTRQHLYSRARRVRRSASRHGSHMIDYLRHYLANRNPTTDQYQMFGTHRPAPLDASSDESDNETEDVLYGQRDGDDNGRTGGDGPHKQYRSGDYHQSRRDPQRSLTEIDWSIMGTGLDIDLASQLDNRPVMRQPKDYLNDHSATKSSGSEPEEEGQIVSKKIPVKQQQPSLGKKLQHPLEVVKKVESVSLLMSNVNLDDDDDGLCEPPRENPVNQSSVRLIDFERFP